MAKEKTKVSIWGKLLAWGLLVALLTLVGIQLANSQRGILSRGEPAPDFSLITFEGDVIDAEAMQGKVMLLNIWASWCLPCEQEAEALQTAWEQYEGRGDVLFLGVDYVDTQKNALEYLDRWGITYPNGPDLESRIYAAFRARGVPETFIINKLGEVAFVKIGPFASLEEITATIDRLLEP